MKLCNLAVAILPLALLLAVSAAAADDAIFGLQVDITGIDDSLLEVVEYLWMIQDDIAMSNTASSNPEKSSTPVLCTDRGNAVCFL